MFPYASPGCGLWWIFPLIMVAVIVLCFSMMKGRMSSMMCRSGFCRTGSDDGETVGSALETLNKRYAGGEINREEYEEKKAAFLGSPEHRRNNRC